MRNEIMVSIRCTVFNHAPFLRNCLDGIVSQQTSFQFEAIVHDDASTDDSAAIIREYADNYPDIIKPIIEQENLYSKNDGRFDTITYDPSLLRGKYIAMCEGDDYWTDPYKLEKQISYLEKHQECSMVFTNALMKWDNDAYPARLFSHLKEQDYSGLDIVEHWMVPTASVVYRREVLLSGLFNRVVHNKKLFVVGDTPIFLTCAQLGKLHAFPYASCVYRRHNGGFLLSADSKRRLQLGDYRLEIPKVFGPEFKRISVLTALPHYRMGLRYSREEKDFRKCFVFAGRIAKVYLKYPIICCSRIKQILKEKKEKVV